MTLRVAEPASGREGLEIGSVLVGKFSASLRIHRLTRLGFCGYAFPRQGWHSQHRQSTVATGLPPSKTANYTKRVFFGESDSHHPRQRHFDHRQYSLDSNHKYRTAQQGDRRDQPRRFDASCPIQTKSTNSRNGDAAGAHGQNLLMQVDHRRANSRSYGDQNHRKPRRHGLFDDITHCVSDLQSFARPPMNASSDLAISR